MTKPTVLQESPITMAELKAELGKMRKRDGELNFRANKTEEYVNEFPTVSVKEADDMKEELAKLDIPRVKDVQIAKIIDLMPDTPEEVKLILQGYNISLTKDAMDKIIEVVKKHSK